MRGATLKTAPYTFDGMISIHAPRAGGDAGYYPFRIYPFISIHAPRAGGDARFHIYLLLRGAFQSTPPVRGATRTLHQRHKALDISIHAPRAGGDISMHSSTTGHSEISIHAPRAGGDV